MSEIHRADWAIPYPSAVDEKSIPDALRAVTHVEHDWEAFPWYLAGRLVGLLEKPESSFEYFHVTAFFRARAAMLALKGDVLDHKDLFAALSRHQVQAGGIYRKHLLHYLRAFLKKHNFVQLPECDPPPFDPARDPEQPEKNRDLVQRVVRLSEHDYVSTLNFISVASEMEEEVARHSVGFWVNGADMPRPVDVRVRMRRHDVGYDLLPAHEEVKRLIRAGRPVKKIVVRMQEEFGFAPAGGGISDLKGKISDGRKINHEGTKGKRRDNGLQATDHRLKTEEREDVEHEPFDKAPAFAEERATAGKQGGGTKCAKVIGDYRVIRVDGHRNINLATKHKARAVVRFIHGELGKSGKAEFYVEEMRDAFNAQFPTALAHKRWVSDRFREDLFRGKEREFDLLFEALDKAAGRYRMKSEG